MEKLIENKRLNQVPILYVRGTYSEIGYTIGRQFRYMMEDVLKRSKFFNKTLLPSYSTDIGKSVFNSSLAICKKRFPQYIEEMEGMAEGSQIPFYKLFLFNLEYSAPDEVGVGRCSDVLSNSKNVLLLAHTEDAGPELMNNVFILDAEVLDQDGNKVEKFTSLSYASCLPGYTMGYNEHGVVHAINTLCPVRTAFGKTPRNFIARALLPASNLEEVIKVLKDTGAGLADGFNTNIYFSKDKKMFSIEAAPNPDGVESLISVHPVLSGESYVHCNSYRHMDTKELTRATIRSSTRLDAIHKYGKPKEINDVLNMLSDQSHSELPVFRMKATKADPGNTVLVGVFDIENKKWNIYTQPPNTSKPVAVIPMNF